jgi:HEPN domain-containing protein/predicted nucleotidyltransferase
MKSSLPPQSEHVATQLAAITDVIRELVGNDLVMLILFGSYARGTSVNDHYVEDNTLYSYESDFDLLVVTEDRANATVEGEFRLCDAIGRRLRRLGLDRPRSMVIVEDIEHLNNDLQRGSYFFTDIRNEGVLLFDSGRHALAEACPLTPVEYQKFARDDFEHWYPSAVEFLIDFQHAFDRGSYNKAAFELHQATERFYHAIILTFTRYKPKIHDIEKLDRQASNLHPDFFTVFPRASDQQKHCFDLLQKAYIDARYKRDYVITKEELEFIAARVQKLQELTKRICEEKIAGMA